MARPQTRPKKTGRSAVRDDAERSRRSGRGRRMLLRAPARRAGAETLSCSVAQAAAATSTYQRHRLLLLLYEFTGVG